MSCVQMMASWRGKGGSSIRIANPIRLSTGCIQNFQRGKARILGRIRRYLPKQDVEWTAGELNAILKYLVPSHSGKGQNVAIQWDCELFSGTVQAQGTMLPLQS
jgi:hypothetical protein